MTRIPRRPTMGLPAALAAALLLPAAVTAQVQVPAGATAPQVRNYAEQLELEARSPFAALPWQFIGPTNVSGRVTDVAVPLPKGQHYTIYAATATGGLWKTDNEGISWQPIFQHAPSTSMGDVTVAPSNPDIVWVGTGEGNIFRSSTQGAGVYKSTDAGESWTYMGLGETLTIPRIVIHPTNPDIVYVAASGGEWTDNPERGVYKTTDGGRSWEKIHYVSDRTGAIDLVMDPSNPEVLYAAMWQRIRRKWNDPRVEPGYDESGIWKTTDGGASWRPVNEGLPQPSWRGRIGIDVARSQPNILYAFVDHYEIVEQAEEGQLNAYGLQEQGVIRGSTLYRSDDGGERWRLVSEDTPALRRAGGTYGWVFGQVRVDPNDPDVVYIMGLRVHRSEDGGRTFETIGRFHTDQHALFIDPNNSSYLVNGNDGGIVVSYDYGESWREFIAEIPAVQFFNLYYDNAEPFRVYGSIQDHGSRRGQVDLSLGRLDIPAVDFQGAPGGEGSYHAIPYGDPDIVYSAGFYGRIARANMVSGESRTVVPEAPEGELAYRGQWLAPFIVSPHSDNTVYLGLNRVFRSQDGGDSWSRLSPDLTHNDRSQLGDIPYQTLTTLSESPLDAGLVYAGTDDGRLWVSRNADERDAAQVTWTEITAGLPPRWMSRVEASRYEEGRVYLTQTGRQDDDFTPYVWVSTDHGATWRSLADGVPGGPVNVIREDPVNPDVLYLGTDMGVYVSLDRGATWETLHGELPTTFVMDLVVHPRDRILVAATHGRGMYAMDVSGLQQVTPQVRAGGPHLLEPVDVSLAEGRPLRVPVYYWLNDGGAVTLTVRNAAGQEVRQLEAPATTGMNLATWDLRPTPPARGQGGGGGGGGGFGGFGGGATVPPGVYTIELRQGGTVRTVDLVLY